MFLIVLSNCFEERCYSFQFILFGLRKMRSGVRKWFPDWRNARREAGTRFPELRKVRREAGTRFPELWKVRREIGTRFPELQKVRWEAGTRFPTFGKTDPESRRYFPGTKTFKVLKTLKVSINIRPRVLMAILFYFLCREQKL